MMNAKEIQLKKNMSMEEVNKIFEINNTELKLKDDVYAGSKHKHNWICACGNLIEGRKWEKIRARNSVKCSHCQFGTSDNPQSLNEVRLEKNMTKYDVNKLISKWLTFEEDIYLGNNILYHWKCKCGEVFQRRWMDIKFENAYQCDICRFGIKDEYGDIKDVYIKARMSNAEVNKVISKWILLNDEVYLGALHRHNWLCACGEVIEGRSWANIKTQNQLRCNKCRYEETEYRYKYEVEKDGDYEYIRSFRKGDMLSDGRIVGDSPYVKVRHKLCGSAYEVMISSFINNKNRCGKCCGKINDSIWYNNRYIADTIISDEFGNSIDTKTISTMSHIRLIYKCPKCGKEGTKPKSLDSVVQHGYSCEYCSDGVSVPEKFIINLLVQLSLDFTTQLTGKDVDWITKNIRYDFYIPSLHMIIETHGRQHYKNVNAFSISLEEQVRIDNYKKELALNNGISHYIEMDCRKSEFEYLKENVIKSLSTYFDLSNIHWEQVWESSQSSLVIEAWELWNDNWRVIDISNKLKVSRWTVRHYINRGIEIGKCKERIKIS